MPGQSTLEPAIQSHPTDVSFWQNPPQYLIGPPMHIGVSHVDPQNQPLHSSHSTQPSNAITASSDGFDEDMWSNFLPRLFENHQSHTPDVALTGVPPPQDSSFTSPQNSTTERIVPVFVQPDLQPNNGDERMPQSSLPDWSQPQPEQAHGATFIPDTQKQQTSHVAPTASENEWLRHSVLSYQHNASAVRDIFTGFETALMALLEGLGLTDQQEQQVNDLIRPALRNMKNVLNEAVIEGPS